jgi:hypothetical protein
MSVINGKAYWAAVASPNTTFDPDGMWTVDVCNLDEKNVKLAKKDGISIKNKGDDRGDFVTIKRKVRRKDGGMNRAPELMDAQKRTLSNVMIGNGSVVNVLYNTYDWEYRGRQGTSADLRSVQVVDLIPYNSDSDEAFDVVEGYNSTDAVDEDINFN